MQTVSQTLGGATAPQTIEHAGKIYAVGAVTQAVKSEIERKVQADVRASLVGPPGATPPEVVAVALRQHARDVVSGVFGFYGPACIEYLSSPDGVFHLARLLLRRRRGDRLVECSDTELGPLIAERQAEVGHLVEVAIRESLPPAMRAALEKAEQDAAEKAEQDAAEKAEQDAAEKAEQDAVAGPNA